MIQKIDFMQEMAKILLDWAKERGGQVVLLLGAVFGLYYINAIQIEALRADLKAKEEKIEIQEERIDEVRENLSRCDMDRAALKVEVDYMKKQLEARFPRLSFDRR